MTVRIHVHLDYNLIYLAGRPPQNRGANDGKPGRCTERRDPPLSEERNQGGNGGYQAGCCSISTRHRQSETAGAKLEKKIAFLEDRERKRLEVPQTNEEELENIRFSARSVKAQRKRLGLSAADYAKLVGVSPLTIYNWENGKSRPRKEQLAALVAVRGIGKREALRRLELLGEE